MSRAELKLSKRPLRGQASGPIELVVAVIILVASLGLAFMVLQNTQDAQCIDKMKSQMRNVQTYVVDVALGSSSTTRELPLEMGACGKYNLDAVRIVHYDDPRPCGKCPVSSGGCWIVEPLSYDKQAKTFYTVSDAAVCIDVPGRVSISQDDTAGALCAATSTDGCPPDSDPDATDSCSLANNPYAPAGGGKLLTLGKVTGAGTQYTLRLTKGTDLATGEPQIWACLLTREALRTLRESG